MYNDELPAVINKNNDNDGKVNLCNAQFKNIELDNQPSARLIFNKNNTQRRSNETDLIKSYKNSSSKDYISNQNDNDGSSHNNSFIHKHNLNSEEISQKLQKQLKKKKKIIVSYNPVYNQNNNSKSPKPKNSMRVKKKKIQLN